MTNARSFCVFSTSPTSQRLTAMRAEHDSKLPSFRGQLKNEKSSLRSTTVQTRGTQEKLMHARRFFLEKTSKNLGPLIKHTTTPSRRRNPTESESGGGAAHYDHQQTNRFRTAGEKWRQLGRRSVKCQQSAAFAAYAVSSLSTRGAGRAFPQKRRTAVAIV